MLLEAVIAKRRSYVDSILETFSKYANNFQNDILITGEEKIIL